MPLWTIGWITPQTAIAFVGGAILSVGAIYYRHWFQRAVQRQRIARHLHYYFSKIVEAMEEVEKQMELQPQYYQKSHLSQCVTWSKELVDSEARVSELEEPALEMEIRDKVKSAYSAANWQQENYKPAQPAFAPSIGLNLGPMPFVGIIGDLNSLRRKLDPYRGPLFLQWLPRRTRRSRLSALGLRW